MPRSAPRPPQPRGPGRWLVPAVSLVVLGGLVAALTLARPRAQGDEDPLEPADAPPELVALPGGTFTMGSDTGPEDERPAHRVTVGPFQIGKTEVTNGQFAAFVKATGYKTIAERVPDARRYPEADPENLVPGSAVYVPVEASLHGPWDTPYPPWWQYVRGANWRHPDGPKSSIRGKPNHPVVHIAWEDAVEYCKWGGYRLPTEAEWEYAARGGLEKQEFCWGGAKQGEGGKWYANTFQGQFPSHDTGEDGFVGVAPVAQYPPNGYGLYDTAGNVWEWCHDFYRRDSYAKSPAENPPGPDTGELDGNQPLRVRRGGSYLCADGYCRRYLPSARDNNPADSGASHTGFRVAK